MQILKQKAGNCISWNDKFQVGKKPLSYDLRFTLADNRATITKYNNPEKRLSDYYEGMVIGEIWGYETKVSLHQLPILPVMQTKQFSYLLHPDKLFLVILN